MFGPTTTRESHRQLFRWHPELGFTYVPNLTARVQAASATYTLRTNSTGFRSDSEFIPERGERPRILFFGDSLTAGDGVRNHERFAELVGEALDAEVYNYGTSGTGTDQQYLAWSTFARNIEADLVVVGVFLDDVARNQVAYRASRSWMTGKEVLVPKPFFELGPDGLRLENSPVPRVSLAPSEPKDGYSVQRSIPSGRERLYEAVNLYRTHPALAAVRSSIDRFAPNARSWAMRASGYQPYDEFKSESSYGWRLLRAILERFADEAQPVPLLVVPIPTFHHFADGAKPIFQPLFESLASPGRGPHVMNLDRHLRAVQREQRRELVFENDKTHFSRYGHRVVGTAIADTIRELDIEAFARRPKSTPSKPRSAAGTKSETEGRYILGFSAFYHDSAAALVRDGEIVAAVQEERLTREKNDRRFPRAAIDFCLEQGGIEPNDLSAIVYYDDASLTFERIMHSFASTSPRSETAFVRSVPAWLDYKLRWPGLVRDALGYDGLLLQERHHRSHAASTFFASPFERAAILTVDGVGEWATASIARGEGNTIATLQEMEYPSSLGLLYSAFTQFTGFKVNSGEYKMMGLAPYGEARFVDAILDEVVEVYDDGSLRLNLDYFGFLEGKQMVSDRFAQLFGGPPRRSDDRITRREMDIAKSIQVVTEEILLKMARHARELTGEKQLCLAGGVALNCVANGRLLREGPFESIWIQPAAGDAGGALGAALDAHHTYFGAPRKPSTAKDRQQGSYLGPTYGANEIEAFLQTHGFPHQRLERTERSRRVAELLAEGRVVGHFAGRSEFGPRALGARSILGDPRNPEMQVKLNLKIKYRESFRPFAPSVIAERASDYFEIDGESPYMLLVADVHRDRRLPFDARGEDMLAIVRQPRSDLPAITHVDYSARIQTVSRDRHEQYYDLLCAFEELTGCGVLVNTSFNVRGEPIVNSPVDAYRCFMRTEMDVLVLEDFILFKEEQPEWPEAKGHVEHDVVGAPGASDLSEELARLYRTELAPASSELSNSLYIAPPSTNGSAPRRSAWVPNRIEETPARIFELDAGLQFPSEPADTTRSVLSRWYSEAVARRLEPLMRKLLGLRADRPEEKASVSSTMYEMF